MSTAEAYRNLKQFTGMISSACRMPIWGFSPDGKCYYTTCPEQQAFEAFLRINGSLDFFLSGRCGRQMPAVFTDGIGLSYLADFVQDEGSLALLAVMGPFFNSTSPLREAERNLKRLDISVAMRHRMMLSFRDMPVLSVEMLEQYASMMHYCITEEIRTLEWFDLDIASSEVKERKADAEAEETPSAEERRLLERIHIGWILDAVRNGQIDFLESGFEVKDAPVFREKRNFDTEENGRGEKDQAIVYAALCTQAAVEGGILEKQAEEMRETYIGRIEKSRSELELMQTMRDLLAESLARVHDVKPFGEKISKPIQSCCDYIHRHLTDDFSLAELAASVGYTDYYLTKKFYSEMGIRLNDYIKREKIGLAKALLISTDKSIQEIAVELNFSTRSFFTRAFKETVGVSPNEFRANGQR